MYIEMRIWWWWGRIITSGSSWRDGKDGEEVAAQNVETAQKEIVVHVVVGRRSMGNK